MHRPVVARDRAEAKAAVRETRGDKQQFSRDNVVSLFSKADTARTLLHGHDLQFVMEVGCNVERDHSSCSRPLNSFVVL